MAEEKIKNKEKKLEEKQEIETEQPKQEEKVEKEDKKISEKKEKIIVEREYVVPLRREWLKVPKYRRATKAIKALKEFMARHMKVYDKDLSKIRIDVLLNNEIRFMGMKKPLHKIKVKAIKYDNGLVDVKLVQIPKHIEFKMALEARREAERLTKKTGKDIVPEKQDKTQEDKDKEQDIKEKEKSSAENEMKQEKEKAKLEQHTSSIEKKVPMHRKVMKK